MARVSFFFDGFNIYHSLKDYPKPGTSDPFNYKPKYHKYLWLDFYSLAERFVRKQDTISSVYYFTAYATWKPRAMQRHQLLTRALESRGVEIVHGKFKEKDRHCPKCSRYYQAHEEKQTDVNIAVRLLREAVCNSFDTAIVATNDTDIIPAIETVKDLYPTKKIGVLFPIDRWASELKAACHFWRKIQKKDLSKSQFPNPIILPGGVTLHKPLSWV